MNESQLDRRVSAREVGLRELPRAWRGATLRQLLSSAKRVVEQAEAIDGSGDPRLPAAIKILEFAEKSRAEKK